MFVVENAVEFEGKMNDTSVKSILKYLNSINNIAAVVVYQSGFRRMIQVHYEYKKKKKNKRERKKNTKTNNGKHIPRFSTWYYAQCSIFNVHNFALFIGDSNQRYRQSTDKPRTMSLNQNNEFYYDFML